MNIPLYSIKNIVMYIKKDESLPPSRIRIEKERKIKKRKYDNEFKQRGSTN